MKPVCVPCRRFYRPKNNGLRFIESMPKSGNPRPGLVEDDRWVPYKLWCGDLWECEGCGTQTISGVGLRPIAEHYQEGFKEMIDGSFIKINDC